MIISELIKELQEIQKEYGDIESCCQLGDDWYNTDCIKFKVIDQILYFEQLYRLNLRKCN